MKRRQFLLLSGVSAVSSGFIGLSFARRSDQSLAPQQAIAEALEKQEVEKDLVFRFVSVGDTGTGGMGEYAVAKAMEVYHQNYPYDSVILAGDNIYENGNIANSNLKCNRFW